MSTRTRSGHRIEKAGEAPVIRVSKPIKSVGRDKARCYCPACGQKRRACRCDERASK